MDFHSLAEWFSKRGYTESYAEKVTGDSLERFAQFWDDNKKEIQKQLTIITVMEVEAGLSGEEKDIFIRGMLKLPNLWKECSAQRLQNTRIAEASRAKEERGKKVNRMINRG